MRIIISFLVLLILPLVLIESRTNKKPIEKQPKAYYYNTDFNYSLKYPNAFKSVFDQNDTLILKDKENHTAIEISVQYGISNKDIYELSDLFLVPQETKNTPAKVVYHIVDGSYGEISYSRNDQHYFEKIHHLGNRMIKLVITAPKKKASQIDDIRAAIDLEINERIIYTRLGHKK